MPIMSDLEALVRRCRRVAAGGIGRRVAIHHRARDESADEIAEAVGDEVDQPLRGGANSFPRSLVSVNLAADEEEIVADAV